MTKVEYELRENDFFLTMKGHAKNANDCAYISSQICSFVNHVEYFYPMLFNDRERSLFNVKSGDVVIWINFEGKKELETIIIYLIHALEDLAEQKPSSIKVY